MISRCLEELFPTARPVSYLIVDGGQYGRPKKFLGCPTHRAGGHTAAAFNAVFQTHQSTNTCGQAVGSRIFAETDVGPPTIHFFKERPHVHRQIPHTGVICQRSQHDGSLSQICHAGHAGQGSGTIDNASASTAGCMAAAVPLHQAWSLIASDLIQTVQHGHMGREPHRKIDKLGRINPARLESQNSKSHIRHFQRLKSIHLRFA